MHYARLTNSVLQCRVPSFEPDLVQVPPPAPPRAPRCGGATSSKSPAAQAQEEVASCGTGNAIDRRSKRWLRPAVADVGALVSRAASSCRGSPHPAAL